MRALLISDFSRRFAGGFALGALALAALQPQAVAANLLAVAAAAAQVA